MLEISSKTNLLEQKSYKYSLQDVAEPNLHRDVYSYGTIPKVAFNHRRVPMSMPEEIWITDTSLRDGQQSVEPYSVDQIVNIYKLLNKLGGPYGIIRQTEFFIYSKKDRLALEKCMELDLQFPEITSWIRASKEDFKLVKDLGIAETGILVSCSDYHIFKKMKMSRSQCMDYYLGTVKDAFNAGVIPRCHLEDITRADFYGFVVPFVTELQALSLGGDAVGLQKDMVNVIFGDSQLALHNIVKLELIFNRTGASETQYPGVAGIQLSLDVLQTAIPPDGILAVVAKVHLGLFLLLSHGSQLFLSAEAGVGLAFRHQFFGEYMVNSSPLALLVWAVGAAVAVFGKALVKLNAVVLQGVDENLHSAGDLSLGVSILHPQEQHTAALVAHSLRNSALYKVAQVDKTGGRGGHAGNDRALRQAAGREAGVHIRRRVRYMGK